MRPNGIVLWEGTSLIDHVTPVVCIATGLVRGSENVKTGGMVQTYILRSDLAPMEAVKTRTDVGICGGCVHRQQADGNRTCYVNLAHGPSGVYGAYVRNVYPHVSLSEATALCANKMVRLGTYGDPAAVPLHVWKAVTALAKGHTGYTHQWRKVQFQGLKHYTQASCETEQDVVRANARGFGTFHVLPLGAPVPSKVLHCPASVELGKGTTCEQCGACNGRKGVNVVIYAHGPTMKRYTGSVRALPVMG